MHPKQVMFLWFYPLITNIPIFMISTIYTLKECPVDQKYILLSKFWQFYLIPFPLYTRTLPNREEQPFLCVLFNEHAMVFLGDLVFNSIKNMPNKLSLGRMHDDPHFYYMCRKGMSYRCYMMKSLNLPFRCYDIIITLPTKHLELTKKIKMLLSKFLCILVIFIQLSLNFGYVIAEWLDYWWYIEHF